MTYDGSLDCVEAQSRRIHWLNWLGSSFLCLSWLYLNRTAVQWFAHLPHSLSRFNQAMLIGTGLILLIQCILHRTAWKISLEFKVQRLPLLLMFGAAIASLSFQWLLDLEVLPVACFLLGTYGFIGLFLQSETWKRGIPLIGAIAILILLALGPLPRSLIAEIVEFILAPLHIGAISSENILVLNTGIAFVDLPCSGHKSIWTGSLFLIAASLIERRQMGLRWFILYLFNLGLLIVANIARILTLVVLTFVLNQRAIAEIIHVPFGLMSFVTVSILSWGLLRFIPCQTAPQSIQRCTNPVRPTSQAKRRNFALILFVLLGLTFVPVPTANAINPNLFRGIQWPTPMHTETIGLNAYEQKFFGSYPGVVAQKQAFQFSEMSGSMIFVLSPTWRAHHAPELCLTGRGFKVDHMEKQALTSQVTGRWLSLNNGQLAATYWFQSPQRTTDNFLDRLGREITRQDPQWTLVSVLFDKPVTSQDPDVKIMVNQVHDAIAQAMTT